MNLFELFVKIGAKDEASDKISGISGKLKNGLATAAKVGVAAVGAVTAAVGAMGTAFVKGTSELAQYGDNIDKMSQKMGLSAQAYQEWDFIMQHSGTSMEALKAGMKTLANAVESGNKAFERLGITQEEIAAMNQEELFARTLEGLQGVTDETERTYLAGQLLGRGATELGALLNTSAEDVEAMRQQVHDLGGVMSDEAVKAAAAYQDSLQNMQTAFAGVQRGLLSDFLPSMVTVMDGLALIFSGNDSGIAKITEGIGDFADNLLEAVPKIFELGEGILSSLLGAIIENLPMVANSAVEIIMKLIDGILSALPSLAESAISIIETVSTSLIGALPQIITAGIDLIVALVDGISQMLGNEEFIQNIINVVLEIVDILTNPDNIVRMLNAAVTLIVAIGKGLIQALPQLLAKVPEIISNLVKAFGQFLKPVMDIGKNIIDGIKKGISNAWNNLVKWFKGLFGDLIGIAKKILGIASPSKVFKKIGGFTAEGFGAGFEDEFAHIKDDMEDALNFDDASVGINASIRKVGAGAAGGAFGGTSIGNININIDGAKYSDEQSLASAIAVEIQNMTDRRAAVYA